MANALLENIHDADSSRKVDAVWHAAASRRLTEVRAGAAKLVDLDEHYDRLRATLSA